MNICVISGLYATEKFPYGGIFVYEYLKQLKQHDLSYKTYIIRRDYSRGVALVYRIIKRRPLENSPAISWDKSERIIPINCPVNIFDMILYICFPKQYLKTIFKKITDNIEIKSDTLIHAHWACPEGYYAVKLAKTYQVPCVITAYGSDIHTLPQHNKTMRKYLPKILENANKVTFMSKALLNSGINIGYSGENSAIIPVGVDTNIFYPIDKDSASKKTGWRQTKKYVVGFVGNLIPIKRADCLPRIFSIIE
ncbi:glycosyltransferase, partial [Methanocorpusculum sp. GPch4]|uniref:glycosyltransferase n=1 Tax=Methanocorpusculum sp. GPch4 TaxID=2527877 RepID=UPI0014334207